MRVRRDTDLDDFAHAVLDVRRECCGNVILQVGDAGRLREHLRSLTHTRMYEMTARDERTKMWDEHGLRAGVQVGMCARASRMKLARPPWTRAAGRCASRRARARIPHEARPSTMGTGCG